MPEIQEDVAEGAIKWMLKVPKFSAALIIAGLKLLMKALANKEPVGVQKIERLMKDGNQTLKQIGFSDFGKDMKAFSKLAREYGVGFTAFKNGEDYTLFFRAGRAEQMKSCIEAYARQKLNQNPEQGIKEKLEKAVQAETVKRDEPTLSEVKEFDRTQTRGRSL